MKTVDVYVEYQWHTQHALYVASEYAWDLGAPVGYGKTEAAALEDLKFQIEERSNEDVTINVIKRENFAALCPSGW